MGTKGKPTKGVDKEKFRNYKSTDIPVTGKKPPRTLHKIQNNSAKKMDKGLYIHKNSIMYRNIINCIACPFRNTPLCPHLEEVGDQKGKKLQHSNGYCSEWALFVKTNFEIAGTKPKLFQMAEVTKDKIMSDKMYLEWARTGRLHKNFDRIQRNLIKTVADMRRQDEGVKINQDVNIAMQDFRKVVDAQAKVIEGKDIIKEHEKEMEEEDAGDRPNMDGSGD